MKRITMRLLETPKDIEVAINDYRCSYSDYTQFVIERYDMYYVINLNVKYCSIEGLRTFEVDTNGKQFTTNCADEMIKLLIQYFS